MELGAELRLSAVSDKDVEDDSFESRMEAGSFRTIDMARFSNVSVWGAILIHTHITNREIFISCLSFPSHNLCTRHDWDWTRGFRIQLLNATRIALRDGNNSSAVWRGLNCEGTDWGLLELRFTKAGEFFWGTCTGDEKNLNPKPINNTFWF
jgi:hypothetical protein